MKLFKKNGIKILVSSLIFLSAILFFNIASAATLSESVSGLYNFFSTKIIGQIKSDFCKNYILGLSNGDWKSGEWRTNLGKRICTSYTVPSSPVAKITQETVNTLNNSAKLTPTETPSTSSINSPGPDIYVPDLTVNGTNLDIDQILYFTNTERKNNDSSLVNLKSNDVLKRIAEIRVKDMFNLGYFEHNSPTGDNASKEAVKNGYSYITIGENIALGNFDGSRGLLTSWMNSPGHRANILNKNYTEIGISTIQGIYKGQSVWISAQIFGKPMAGCTQPSKTLKSKIDKYKLSADSLLNNIKDIDAELKTIDANDVQKYNTKVAERNTYAKLYNDLATEIKTAVAEYNKETAAYNSCIKTL